jgi:hypothetical protein
MLDSSRWRRRKPAESGQVGLFSQQARRSDSPDTSRVAEAAVRSSGTAETQTSVILEYLEAHPHSTTLEVFSYAAADGRLRDRYSVARRMPELERRGLVRRDGVRRCEIGGMLSQVWAPVQADRAEGAR